MTKKKFLNGLGFALGLVGALILFLFLFVLLIVIGKCAIFLWHWKV